MSFICWVYTEFIYKGRIINKFKIYLLFYSSSEDNWTASISNYFKILRTSRKPVLFHEAGIFRSSYQKCSIKKLFLKISQNSQENTRAGISFFNKISGQLLCRTPPAKSSRLSANKVKIWTRKDISSSRNNLFVAFLAAFGLGGLDQKKVFLNVKL